jgi:hypothetical protein
MHNSSGMLATSEVLEEVVGWALIDRDFCADLLNGRRARVLSRFNLTPEERQALLNIRAESLESFAGQLAGWLATQPKAAPAWRVA